jgi:osmotically-inducible protein OsmY
MKRILIASVITVLSLSSTSLFAFGGSEIPPDEKIKKDVVDQLAWDSRTDASEIEVEVKFGRVILSGTVPSRFIQQAVVEDVWSVNGVIDVDDNLTIEPYGVSAAGEPPAAAVEEALLVDSEVDSSKITVTSVDGHVTLGGTVAALWQKLRAAEIASGVKGVLGVSNEIAVVPTEDVLDDVIAQDVVDAIDRNANVDADKVNVTVDDGYVTLTGTVSDWVARDAAYQAAVNTLGVKGVSEQLTVESDIQPLHKDSEIAKAVRDQLEWDNRVDATDVSVQVIDGNVTLKGTVSSYSAKLAAESNALMIEGVVSVDNELVVEPAEPIANDAFLAARAENVLKWNPDFHVANLAVQVIAGVASLEGQVDALWEKHRAEELVMNINGMIGVINKIAVVPTGNILDETIAEDIVKAIDRNIHVNVDNVTVSVDRGTVTLTGDVPTITAKNAAFDAALNTAGVRAVINNIKVSG